MTSNRIPEWIKAPRSRFGCWKSPHGVSAIVWAERWRWPHGSGRRCSRSSCHECWQRVICMHRFAASVIVFLWCRQQVCIEFSAAVSRQPVTLHRKQAARWTRTGKTPVDSAFSSVHRCDGDIGRTAAIDSLTSWKMRDHRSGFRSPGQRCARPIDHSFETWPSLFSYLFSWIALSRLPG